MRHNLPSGSAPWGASVDSDLASLKKRIDALETAQRASSQTLQMANNMLSTNGVARFATSDTYYANYGPSRSGNQELHAEYLSWQGRGNKFFLTVAFSFNAGNNFQGAVAQGFNIHDDTGLWVTLRVTSETTGYNKEHRIVIPVMSYAGKGYYRLDVTRFFEFSYDECPDPVLRVEMEGVTGFLVLVDTAAPNSYFQVLTMSSIV